MPCRNEEHILDEIFRSLPREIDEVIVVDNRSTDRSMAIAASHGAKVISELRTDHGVGYGYALQTGIAAAQSDIVFTMDADGTYPSERIGPLVTEMLSSGLDFVSCCRLPREEEDEKLWIRIFGVVVLNTMVRILYGFPMRDCLSGMMVMQTKKFTNRPFQEGGWNFSLELKLVALCDPSVRFAEIHIPYHDRVVNQSKQQIFVTGFKHLWYLFRFRFTRLKKVKQLAAVPVKNS